MSDLAFILGCAIVAYGLVRVAHELGLVAGGFHMLATALRDVRAHHTYRVDEPREPWQEGD